MKKIKNSKPFFSIITPVKNGEKNIKKTLLSLRNQSFRNFEHIIVDGDSKDKTKNIIRKYKSKKIILISGKDKGIYDGINKGIKIAKGKFIGTLNSGDTYNTKGLEIIHKYFNKNKLDFIFGTVKKDVIKHGFNPSKIFWSFNFYPAHSSGFFISRVAQNKIGNYDLKFQCSSDYDLFYKMIVKYKMKGTSTKRNEIIGNFELGGYSQQITLIEHILEETKIRLQNKQNTIIVFLIFILRIIKNFYKLNLIKYFRQYER